MSAEKTWRYVIVDASDEKASINFTAGTGEGLLNAVSGSYSVGQTIDLLFTPNSDYQFIKWDYDSSILKIKDPANPDTTITVIEKTSGTQSSQVKAVCAPRPRIVENGFSPVTGGAVASVSKNTPIQITFTQNLPDDEAGRAQMENINIAIAGNPVKSSFLAPSIAGGTVTFNADPSNMLDVPVNQTKTVTVTIPADFYYELEDEAHTKVYYGGNGKSFNYKIDETTNEQTIITFTTSNTGSGTITKGPRQGNSYSLGERIDLAFALDENFQFNGWKIYDAQKTDITNDINAPVTIDKPSALTTTLNVNAEVQGIKVVADASMKLFVTEMTPNGQINNKDSDITITLSKLVDSSCSTPEFLNNISVKLNGTPVDDYFENRSVNGNKIIIANTKYLNVTENEIKTVSVTMPQSFYYKDRDITINLNQSFMFEYQVNSTTTKTVTANYSTATANSGSINQNPTVTYNIGDTVDLKFNLANGYQFTVWQIVDQNGAAVSNDKIKIDDTAATNTKMHILAPVEGNIEVSANAFLVPKISSISPSFESFGSDQDSTIEITFNKAVNTQTFGDFSCITITDASGEKLAIYGSTLNSYNQSHPQNPFATYYETPYFSQNNTVLNIPTVKGKYLVNKDFSDTKDIIVNINLSQVKDTEGKALESFAPYTYRVNKKLDNIAPVLTSAEIYSTSDTESPYYKKLSEKDFGNWSTTEHDGYTFGDYSQNHVSGSVYLKLQGSDIGSGVSKIQVTETYYRSLENAETMDSPRTYLIDFSKEGDFYTAIYTINSMYDGIIKLELALFDYSELASNTETFYVLKDTQTNEENIKFKENYEQLSVDFREVSDMNEDEVTLTHPAIDSDYLKDIFYVINNSTKLVSYYDMQVYWGYSQDSFPYKAEKEETKFSFTRDASKLVYIKIVGLDDVGNRLETIRPLAPQPDFDASCIHLQNSTDDPVFEIIPYGFEVLETLRKEQFDIVTYYLFYTEGAAKPIVISSIYLNNHKQGLERHSGIGIGINYDVYIVLGFQYPGFDYIWYSPKSSKLCKMKFKQSGNYKVLDGTVEFDDSNSSGINDNKYIDSSPSLSFEEMHNTGLVKVSIDNYQNPENDCTGVSYTFKCKNKETATVTLSNEPVISLISPASYDLFIEAKDPEGNLYGPTESCEINLTQDVSSPVFSNVSNHSLPEIVNGIKHPVYPYEYTPNYYIEYFVPRDEGGLLTREEDNKVEIDYYLIPNSNRNLFKYTPFSLLELQTIYKDYKKTLYINLDDEIYIIPFDGLEEGYYTLCEVVWDKNQNYAIHYQGVLNKTFGKKAEFSFTLNSETDDSNRYRLKCADTLLDNCIMYIYDSDNGIWKEDIDIHGYYGVTIPKTKFEDKWVKIVSCESSSYVSFSGFYDVEYMYPDYHKGLVDPDATKIICENKNIIDGKNGIQVFCDAPAFAHTMYCSKLLSKDNPQIWENKGMETGVVIKSNNYTYSSDNYEGVPSKAYYCTIVHFADGSMLMSDVKKK